MPLTPASVACKADVHGDECKSQDALGKSDVLYVMRVQEDRFADEKRNGSKWKVCIERTALSFWRRRRT